MLVKHVDHEVGDETSEEGDSAEELGGLLALLRGPAQAIARVMVSIEGGKDFRCRTHQGSEGSELDHAVCFDDY